jgi:regulatory protein
MSGRVRDASGASRREPPGTAAVPSGTVTRLALAGRGESRVRVELDGAYAFDLDVESLAGVKLGAVLTPGDVAALLARDGVARAYGQAVRFLAPRPRSEWEIRRSLAARRCAADTIDAVCDRLRGAGLLDDVAFAAWWVANRLEHQPRGRAALRDELRAKGLARDVIKDVVDNIDERDGAARLACAAARRASDDDLEAWQRQVAALLRRRGFGSEAIRHGVRAGRAAREG